MMPFSTEQFLQVFQDYNGAVFPFQAVLIAMALLTAVLAASRTSASSKIVSLFLGFLWLWMGVAYHLLFFSEINPAAFLFAAIFIAEGVMFFREGVVLGSLSFQAERNIYGFAGLLLILYALLVYPILGYLHGEVYPSMPTFGLPCPTTIFTFGILLWTNKRVSPLLLVIPFFWSLIGVFAAVTLGIEEDFALPVAGIITIGMLLYRNSKIYHEGGERRKYE